MSCSSNFDWMHACRMKTLHACNFVSQDQSEHQFCDYRNKMNPLLDSVPTNLGGIPAWSQRTVQPEIVDD